MANRNKISLKILEKRERGRIQEVPKFFGYPQLSQVRIKLRTLNFVGTFIGSIRKNSWKMLGIVAMGIVRESQKFSGHPYLGRIARSSLRQHSFLVKYLTCELQNKEYLIAIFRHWPLSCKQFLSEHFAENRMTLWRTVAKLWCINFVQFFWNTL